MGRLKNFDQIKWMPFKKRIGNIEVSNFYIDENGIPKPNQSHITKNFNYFSIDKIYPNEYYGKESEYTFDGNFYISSKSSFKISPSCFKNPESKFMLARWVDMDHDEKSPDLRFVGRRPIELTDEESKDFWNCVKIGQEHIESVLNGFDENEY